MDGVRYVLTDDHDIPERAPLVLEPGESVQVGDRGWSWCRNAAGREGWIPDRSLRLA